MAELIIPAFVAGILMFLAPCTLPLVPAYLALISGVPMSELEDSEKYKRAHWRIVTSGFFFVLGFSVVFIALGSLAGVLGQLLIEYRLWIARLGGLLVIAFGFFMLEVIQIPGLTKTIKFNVPKRVKKGTPIAAFLIGAVFAFGWSPCIGPVLGSVLLLASMSNTVWQGTGLLLVFSLGLAIPFMIIAFVASSAVKYVRVMSRYLRVVSVIGGVFLILIGFLMVTDNMSWFISFAYKLINFEQLINFL